MVRRRTPQEKKAPLVDDMCRNASEGLEVQTRIVEGRNEVIEPLPQLEAEPPQEPPQKPPIPQ
jgi:hypothetical protein